jgi:hypothetical protein
MFILSPSYCHNNTHQNTGTLPAAIVTSSPRSTTTSLNELLSPEERTDKINRWGEIRSMTKEEAASALSPEDLETYNNYFAEVREGVLKMQELARLVMQDVDKTKGIAPKSKSQRKRDKWARVQSRAAGNAAAALKTPF